MITLDTVCGEQIVVEQETNQEHHLECLMGFWLKQKGGWWCHN